MMTSSDTIAAVATAFGEASVGIVRVSGDGARDIVERVFRSPSGRQDVPSSRGLAFGFIVDPWSNERLDEGILLWMPAPRSYTAEDVAELQVHGGIRTVEAVLSAVLRAGARLAEPGEFTKRAFLNGRIDLSQAEGVIDLIRAKTDVASRAALRQVQGGLGEAIRGLRRKLIRLQAHVEVTLDYPEHDVEDATLVQVVEVGVEIGEGIRRLLDTASIGQILREGVRAVIAGKPNVGKSSLLNALLRRDRAIVTEVAGTTRDLLEEYANIRGIPFRLVDTAGIRETADIVERLGVQRSEEMLQDAELTLVVLDGSSSLTDEDWAILRKTGHSARIVVVNKADLGNKWSIDVLEEAGIDCPVVELSAKAMEGLEKLEEQMEEAMAGGRVVTAELAYVSNARQTKLLEESLADMMGAVGAARDGATLDIVAVQLQAAYGSLGLVIGEEVGEDLLDEIFSQFCLGK